MQLPTWSAVGIPQVLVQHLRSLPANNTLNVVMSQVVFRQSRRLTITYYCDACGHTHVPSIPSVEVGRCPSCSGRRVHCVQTMRSARNPIMPYCQMAGYFNSVLERMGQNLAEYTGEDAQRYVEWSWSEAGYAVSFTGGETCTHPNPRVATCKASILVPYLWDVAYDWATGERSEPADCMSINHLLMQFARERE